jgi:hypothetical protein
VVTAAGRVMWSEDENEDEVEDADEDAEAEAEAEEDDAWRADTQKAASYSIRTAKRRT